MRNLRPTLTFLALAHAPIVLTPAARSQDVTGTHTGADGASASGTGSPTSPGTPNYLFAGFAGSGLTLYGGTYNVHGAAMSGGRGGTATGTTGADQVLGGMGGLGLHQSQYASAVTIASGTFTGGNGGAAGGVASKYINGGEGGSGYYAQAGTTVINSGTFRGGDGAGAGGAAPTLYGGRAGYGLDVGEGAAVTINGGTFIGGDAPGVINPGGVAYDGLPSSGVQAYGTVNIYGGTFTAGTFTATGPHGIQSHYYDFGLDVALGTVTIYGSNFTVNGVSNFSGVVPVGIGTITGKLQNNAGPTSFTYDVVDFYGGQHGTLILVATPEPSGTVALGLGMFGLAGLGIRAYRRKVQG